MTTKIKRFDDNEVIQEIDLRELFGQPVTNPLVRKQIGQAAIDIILERTSKGVGLYGNKLKAYSKAYKKSEDFALYGKTNTVNMELTGEMLSSLDIMESAPTKIVLGFNDPTQAAKATNHQYGISKGMPARPFFGLNNQELQMIKEEFEDEIENTLTVKDLEENFLIESVQEDEELNMTIGEMLES